MDLSLFFLMAMMEMDQSTHPAELRDSFFFVTRMNSFPEMVRLMTTEKSC